MTYQYTEPTPLDIHHALTKASVGERSRILSGLIGLPVCWKATFFEANQNAFGFGRTQLSMTAWAAMRSVDMMLFAGIDLASYPQLAEVHRGRKLVVSGTIESLEDFHINLNLQGLELLPEHFWDSWGQV